MAQRWTDPKDTPMAEAPTQTSVDQGYQPPAPPRVSMVFIAHNQHDSLVRALTALCGATDRAVPAGVEILIVDCASQDDTGTLDQSFPGVTMLRLPHHFGATKAMNIATRTARGELLLFATPELEIAPDAVAALADQLDRDSSAAACAPALVDPQGAAVPQLMAMPAAETLSRICAGESGPATVADGSQERIAVEYPIRAAVLVRKSFVVSMNYFDERYGEYWADADLAMRIRRAQKRIYVYPGVRATLHPTAGELDPLLVADRITGAAEFLGKYKGFLAGMSFRWGFALKALLRLDFGLFANVVGGAKLDAGSQG
jgi:glycosyltransferase involved in cell wall biosynthesis